MKSDVYYDEWSYMEFRQGFSKDKYKLVVNGPSNESLYLSLITDFTDKGIVPDHVNGEPLYDYIVTTMHDAHIQAAVFSDDIQARIFADNMLRLVDICLNRTRFNFNRKQAEMGKVKAALDWNPQRRKDGWQALIEQLESDYTQYGFRSALFRNKFQSDDGIADDNVWQSLNEEYIRALNNFLQENRQQTVDSNGETTLQRINTQMSKASDYVERNQIPHDMFHQAWGLMGGEWVEHDFERLVTLVRLQERFPILKEIASVMGRYVNPNGKQNMLAGTGSDIRISHAAKTDIEGVTMSSNIDSLLPTDRVQMADDELEPLFLQKLTTGKLQNFLHRSEQLNPNRRLHRLRASNRGPMIVCADTSASMQGTPRNITRSMILKLVDIARRQNRHLFLIAFSVSANPIDAQTDRVRLLDFFRHESTGSTDSTQMFQTVFTLLRSNPNYMCADVLMVSDFHMRLISESLLAELRHHQQCGTMFYGLQVGEHNSNPFRPVMDKTYSVAYKLPRKLGK